MEAARKETGATDWERIARFLAFRYKLRFDEIGALTLAQVACLMATDDDDGEGVEVKSRAEVEAFIAYMNME